MILSQLFRGFCKVIRSEKEITAPVLAACLQKAVETAYKAVMKPKEGTILTVAKGAAEEAVAMLEENPDMRSWIPCFQRNHRQGGGGAGQDAGDASGAEGSRRGGLRRAGSRAGAEGRLRRLSWEKRSTTPWRRPDASSGESSSKGPGKAGFAGGDSVRLLHGIHYSAGEALPGGRTSRSLRGYLESLGDSIVVVSDEELVKVHVHTNDPGLAIQKALTYGSLTKIKIDNMREEHQEKVIREAEKEQAEEKKAQEPPKETGFIAVSIGSGIGEVFRDLGVDYLIEGGQTMNPSTEDMLKAIDAVNAKNIFIFPNNKNIILAANQARSMTEDKNIIVIPTKTVPQGITAIVNYVADKSPEENAAVMEEEISRVKTGQLTYAVRDTHIEDKVIQAGDIMGVGDHEILAVGKELDPVAMEEPVRLMVDEDSSELISIYYGEDMREDEAAAAERPDRGALSGVRCGAELRGPAHLLLYHLCGVISMRGRHQAVDSLKGSRRENQADLREGRDSGRWISFWPIIQGRYDSFEEPIENFSELREGETAAVRGCLTAPLSGRHVRGLSILSGASCRMKAEEFPVAWFNMAVFAEYHTGGEDRACSEEG